MDLGRVQYVIIQEDEDEINLEARVDGVRIGYAWSDRTGDRIKLTDFYVEPTIKRRWPLYLRILNRLGYWHPPPLRRQGIGSGLLERLMERADATGVREVWGNVVKADVDKTPGLLKWYAKRGFVIQGTDAKYDPGSANKIVRQRR